MKDYIIDKLGFVALLGIMALLIAAISGFFSVYGIATLFAGAFIYTAVMASSLEAAKVVSVVFLYRYWNKVGRLLKWYLVTAVVVLMVVTSLGIFGFLSSAYQKSSIQYGLTQSQIKMVEDQKDFHYDSITNATARITMLNDIRLTQERRLSDAQTNTFLTRNPIQLQQLQTQTGEAINAANTEIKEKNTEIKSERDAIQKLDQQIGELKIGASQKKDIQTLKYVADQVGWSLDKVAFWFMMAIIFVFDPLAIALILAYNVAVFRRESLNDGDINPQPEPPAPKS